MRCPSCGTDNAPDSRFCGGCGTRFAVSGQRVAPTQKISDDASFPQRQIAPGAGSAVPITAPGVVAPRAIPAAPFLPQAAPPTQRPFAGGSAAPARPPTAPPIAPVPWGPEGHAPPAALTPPSPRPSPRPQAVVVDEPRDATRGGVNSPALPAKPPAGGKISPLSIDEPRDATRGGVNSPALPAKRGRESPLSIDPSLSLPIAARRPWALIVVVLLIDLGLAAAGIWMLTQGLGSRPGRAAPSRSGGLTSPMRAAPGAPDVMADAMARTGWRSPATRVAVDASGPTGVAPLPPGPS